MAEKSVRTSPSDREIDQAIVTLKKGAYLLKWGRRGKPKFCSFRLSMDEKVLIWYSGEKEKQLKLNSVSKIVPGQKTVNFLRQRQPEKESQSFSLIYQNGECTLDLICKDKQQAQSWFLGLAALVSALQHPRPFPKLKNSRGALSCVNSPIGHIQRKHKLGLLQDSVKMPQVHSLYGSPPRYFSNTVLDSSDVFYSSRHRTLSDMQPFLDKLLPHFPQVMSDNSKYTTDSDMIKEHRMISSSTISLPNHEIPSIGRTETLKDVLMWGEGIGGLLGGGLNRHDIDALLPKILESTQMLDVHNISCGEKHTALVTKQGEVFCWGKENGGRLGHKINMDMPYPKVVESLSRVCVQTIACGTQHTCAVTSSGELYTWGDSSYAYAVCLSGEGCNRSQWLPHRISGPLDGIFISKVSCGEWHTALVASSGQLFTFGVGTFGVLGHGNVESVSQPKEVESLKGLRVKSVACGPWHTAAIVEVMVSHFKSNAPSGKLFTWGDSDKGTLGHADKERKLLPTCVASLVDCDFVQVSCGRMLTAALTVNGIVFTMGSSVNGQLGNPQAENTSITTVEGLLKGEFVKEISSGSFHMAVLTTKGQVYTWGKGANGRLGLGDTNDRDAPALVEALEDRHVQSIACGSSFTAAISSHKSMSSKDQSVCSGCGLAFGFTKKKHNCYNCGSVICHSCSGKKATNASLAPDKSKKCRVCDSCFSELKHFVDARISERAESPRQPLMARKGLLDLKISMEEPYIQTNIFPPKSSMQEEIKLADSKAVLVQESNLQYQDSLVPFFGSTQKWGQVPCPRQFILRTKESPLMFGPLSKECTDVLRGNSLHSPSVSKFLLPRATSLKQDLTRIDKMLTEELQRLHNEELLLSEQCQSNNQKLQQYRRRIEETWALSRDEAAKCKAAKDVIKVLTNQMNAISERLLAGREMNSVISIIEDKVDICTPRPVRRELSESDSEDAKLNSGIQDKKTDRSCDQLLPFSDVATNAGNFNGTDETGIDRRENAPKALKDEWVEQDERGVYITFITLPSGQKGLKRVRFSRKHFSAKQAEHWWEENQTRICVKYSIERILMPSKARSEN